MSVIHTNEIFCALNETTSIVANSTIADQGSAVVHYLEVKWQNKMTVCSNSMRLKNVRAAINEIMIF